MSDQTQKPVVVPVELTDAQEGRVAEIRGDARLAAADPSIELTVEELEQRIAPRLAAN